MICVRVSCRICGHPEVVSNGLCAICHHLEVGIQDIQREKEAKAFLIILGATIVFIMFVGAIFGIK